MRLFQSAFAALVLTASGTADAEEPRFEVVSGGPTIQAEVGMSRAGYRIMSDVGGESAGIRKYGQHWLFSWDLLAGMRLGVLANTEPYLFLLGVRASAFAEPVYRFMDRAVSPVVSVRIGADASYLWAPTAPHPDLDTLNDMDGVGGVVARGLVRAGGGASFLGGGRSLLLQGFAQESLRAHGQNSDGKAFSGGGASARFDWTWGLSATLEATGATTLALEDPALRRTVRTTRFGAGGNARKIFGNGVWLALLCSIARDSEHVTYEATPTTFDVASPADFTLGVGFGFSPWGHR